MVAIADNGLFSSNIRELLGMSPIATTTRTNTASVTAEKEYSDSRKTDTFQSAMLKATKEQTALLKKLLEKKESISPSAITVATGMVAANIASKIPAIKKTMDALDKLNAKVTSTAEKIRQPTLGRQSYARSPTGVPRIPAVSAAGRPLNQSMIKPPSIGGLTAGSGGNSMLSTLGTIGGAGLGGFGLASLAGGASKALGFAGGLASKVALPLAAAYAGFEGIKGGMNADKILGREATTFDKVRVGVNEAIDGVLLGLPSLITENVFGKKYSVAVNELMLGIGDSVSSVVSSGWDAVKDNSLKAFESIYNSFPSYEQVSSTFGAVRDKLYDTVSGFSESIASNATSFLSNASTWISGKFEKATSAVGNFIKGDPAEKARIENNLNEMNGKSAEVVGEKVSDYLDEKLKRRDEGFMSWLKGLMGFGQTNPNSDPVDSKGMTIGSNLSGPGNGGNNAPNGNGNNSSQPNKPNASVNSATPAPSYTPLMSSVGKDSSGNNINIPLSPEAGVMFSKDGKFDYANPNAMAKATPTGGSVSYSNKTPQEYFGASTDVNALPAGMRNNNPGNIKYNANVQWNGLVGPSKNTDQGDPQAVFNSPESGMRASAKLSLNKYNGGAKTLNDLIAGPNGWTPGNTGAAANIAKSMGIKPTDDLQLNDPERHRMFLKGLIAQEHGPSGSKYTDATIKEGVDSLYKKDGTSTDSNLVGGYKEPSYLKSGTTDAGRSLGDTVPLKLNDKTQNVDLESMSKDRSQQAFAGGNTHGGTLAAAKAINALQGDNLNRFTGFNDKYHKDSSSPHARGLAGDFTLKDTNKSSEAAEQLRGMFRKTGLTDNQVKVIDEYKNPSKKATAGHIHYQFNTPEAAGAFFKSIGDPKVREALGIKDADMNKSLDDKTMTPEEKYKNSPFRKMPDVQGFGDEKSLTDIKAENAKHLADYEKSLTDIKAENAKQLADYEKSKEYQDYLAKPVPGAVDPSKIKRIDYPSEEERRGGAAPDKATSDIKTPENKSDVAPAEESNNAGNGGFSDTAPANFNQGGSDPAANAQQAFNSTPSIDNELAMLSVNSSMLS